MFWVAKLAVDNYPTIQDIQHKATLDEALATGTTMALENNAPDTAAKIRQELEDGGVYVPTKHAEWSICYGEVDVPVELLAPPKPKKKWGNGYSDGKRR